MDVSVNTFLFVSAAGLLQATFLAALIYFHPKADGTVSKFLALYIFFLCLPMLSSIIQHFFPWQYLMTMDPVLLLQGPLLYLYVRSFKERITLRKAWPHFIMFGLFMAAGAQLFLMFSQKYPMNHDVPTEVVHHPLSMLRIAIRITHMMVYYFLASSALTSYQQSINHMFSETSKINLAWVRWLVNGFFVLTLIMLGFYFLILQNPTNFRFIILLNTSIVTPYIYIVAFKGITQPTIWQSTRLTRETVEEEIHHAEELQAHKKEEDTKGVKSNLSPEKTDDIVAKALAVMEGERLYLQTELTLQDLADKIGIPSYQVSQAINEGLKKTFYDLVNGYRVEEAKRLLLDPKNKNNKILAVGFDSGFNSKTTFNTVFKKFTGLTPTDFKEEHSFVEASTQ